MGSLGPNLFLWVQYHNTYINTGTVLYMSSLSKHEQMVEMFEYSLSLLEKQYKFPATYTVNAGWVTIVFGTLYTIKKRGYAAAIAELDKLLTSLWT